MHPVEEMARFTVAQREDPIFHLGPPDNAVLIVKVDDRYEELRYIYGKALSALYGEHSTFNSTT